MQTIRFQLETRERHEIILITPRVEKKLEGLRIGDGLCTVSTPHTTAAITINENADPEVRSDLTKAFRALVPDVKFAHGEGNSDAHFLSALIGASVTIPFIGGKLRLGRWQGIYYVELDGPRVRDVEIYLLESCAR